MIIIKKEKKLITRIVISVALLLVLLYSIKNVSLSIFGSTTTGYVTSTSQRYDRDSELKTKRYKNTAYYYFEIDGKKYESFVTYNTNAPIVRKEDQQKEKVTVQYFKFFPKLSTLEKYNENKPINYIAWGLLSMVCILGILSVNGILAKNKKTMEVNNEENINN